MIVDEYLKMPITNRNIAYYKNKGYDCHISETIDVFIDDINPGSPIKERRICDVCGQEYIRKHNLNISSFSRFNKDVCCHCFKTNKEVKDIIQEKREKCFLEKYGETNPMFVPELIDKIGETMTKKYGVKNASQVEEFKKKQEETMINLYGAPKALQIKQFQEKFINTITENYSVKTSSQQVACYNMLIEHGYDAYLNAPFSNCILDILIIMPDGTKIDFEYDGSFWHDKEQKIKDRRRDEFLKRNNFKIIRIESRRSIPTWEQIQSEIDYLVEDKTRMFAHICIDEINDNN